MIENPQSIASRSIHAIAELLVGVAEQIVSIKEGESEEQLRLKMKKPVKKARAILAGDSQNAAE